MERPAMQQLRDLQELQMQHSQQMQRVQRQRDDLAREAGATPTSSERGLRDFNYNGRVRNSDRASARASSGVLGNHQAHRSSYSIYSNYSSYPSSDAEGSGSGSGRGSRAGGGRGGRGGGASPPPAPAPQRSQSRSGKPSHNEQPRRMPAMEMRPAPGTSGTVDTATTAVAGTESVRHPPPTYVPSQDPYNRVRFADEERWRGAEARPQAAQIDMAHIAGGHNMRALWVFACCAFFCYRCIMDEDF
ncbi:hypothetical protein EsH8_VIII_000571 [Colletotrichum jinshuiense]